MDIKQQRLELLRRVASGELSLSEGNRLLHELEMNGSNHNPDRVSTPDPAPSSNPGKVVLAEPMPGPAKTVIALGAPTASAGSPDPVLPQDSPPASVPPLEHGEVLGSTQAPASDAERSPVSGWRSLWVLIFLFGLLITLFAATWIYQGFLSAGLSWGFWFSFIPFGLGVLLMWAGWEMRLARWLHVRIHQAPGSHSQTLSFGMPLPIGLTRWAVQRFGHYSPVSGQDIGDFLDQMDQAVATEDAMHISVEGHDGSQVEIWIEGPAG